MPTAPLFGSDDTRKRRSRLAEAMMMQGLDSTPISHWSQGLTRGLSAAVGGYIGGEVDREEKESRKKLVEQLLRHPDLAGQTATPAASPNWFDAAQAPPAAPPQRPEQPLWTGPGLPGAIPPTTGPTTPPQEATWHMRQNNPGNVRQTPESLKVYPGAQPGQNGFLAFQTPEQGLAAVAQTFRHIAKTTGQNTLVGILSSYAPKGDGANDPVAYAAAVGRETGIDPNAPFDVNDPAVMAKIIPAVVKVETGAKGQPYSPQQLASATGRPPGTPAAPPTQTAEAPSATATDALPPRVRDYVKELIASGDPAAMQMGMGILQQYSTPSKPTDEMREYQLSRLQGETRSFTEWKKALKAPLVQIDQRGESEFDKKAAGYQAERFDKIVQGGADAKAMIAHVQTLRDIGSRITTGKTAQIKAALGPYAEMAGIKIDNLDDLQAYESIVAKLAPTMRVAGSSATSDFEMQQFLKALPGLGKTPGGNELVSRTLDMIAQHKVAAAEIASRALTGEITRREAEKQLRELPDPLSLWKQSRGSTAPLGTGKPDDGWKDMGNGVRIRPKP